MASEGVAVYAPTADELGQFRELAQPAVLEWLRGELGDDAEWIDRLQTAIGG